MILIIAADIAIRRLLAHVLNDSGIIAWKAGTMMRSLDILRRHYSSLTLVIVDIDRPVAGIAPLDLAADLHRRQSNLKILYLTRYPDSIAMKVIARSAPDMVLTKPFTAEAFISQVGRLLPTLSRGAIREEIGLLT